jgi:acyl carrier protein
MSVRDALFEQLAALNLPYDAEIDEDTRLFELGGLESLSLMRLAQWIEAEVGGDLDLTSFNVMEEWRTPGAIVAFIKVRKGSGN